MNDEIDIFVECRHRIRLLGKELICNGEQEPLSGMTEGESELCEKCYDCPLRIRGVSVI